MVIKVLKAQFTSKEGKELLKKGQEFIDKKIFPKPKKEKTPTLLEKDAVDVGKIDAAEGLKPKKIKKLPIVSEDKSEKLLFRKESKITPTKLDDFNISKIETRDDILKFIDEISTQFKTGIDRQKRGKITNEATQEMATLLQLNPERLGETLLALKPGQTLNAETILAARELLIASLNRLDELAIIAKTGGTEDILKFRQHYAITSELQKIIKGVQTETGRALQQFKIPVRDKRFTAANIDDLNRQQLMMELGGEEQIRNFAIAHLKLDTKIARAAVNEKTGLIGNLSKGSEALSEIFINAILSNPMTHVRNGVGNWITQGILLQERRVAAKLFGGKIDEVTGEAGIAEFEGMAKAYGRSQAAKEMFAAISKAFSEGKMPTIKNQFGGSKVEIRPGKFTADNFNINEGNIATGVDVLGKILTLNRIPTKLLTVADSYFKNLEYRSEIYAYAYRETVKLVRTGKITMEDAPQIWADFVVNPSEIVTKKAFDKTLASVYQTKLGTRGDILDYGQFIQGMKNKSGPANVLFNYYLPFVQTPANIVGFTLERTPGLNLILKSYRDDIFGRNGLEAAQLAKTKMGLGFLLYTAIAGMNYTKPGGIHAVGTSPELGYNFKKRWNKSELEKMMGAQPSTIVFPNGMQLNTTGYDPIAMYMRQASDFATIAQMGFTDNDQASDFLNHFTVFLLSTGDNLASSTFMSGVGKAFDDYQNYEMLGAKKGFQRQAKQFASSFVPTIVKQGTKVIGDDSRMLAISFNEYFKKAWNSSNLNKDYDLLGDEIEKFGLISWKKEDPIRNEIIKTGVEISKHKKGHTVSVGGLSATVEYNSGELSFLKQRSGAYAKTLLAELFASDEYNSQDLDNFQKQEYIKKVFSASKKAAKADLFFNSDDTSDNYVDYPEEGLGPYENSLATLSRVETKAQELLIEEIKTKNLGEPVKHDYINNNN